MRRWQYDPAEIHDVGPSGAYWGWHGINPRGWIALLAGVGVCLLTINAPILHGPVSDALAGADLTWTVGPLVSAAAYWVLARGTAGGQSRRSSLARATATARVSASSLR